MNKFDELFDVTLRQAVPAEAHSLIQDDSNLLELGVDSTRFIRLVMELEDALGVFFPIEQLAQQEKLYQVGSLRVACSELYHAHS